MILNKEILIEALYDDIIDTYDGYDEPMKIDEDIDYLHDLCLDINIGELNIEENDIMYGEMLSILNTDGIEISNLIDDFIEEEFQPSYMGEPAFSSSADYWGYILGR